MGAARVQTRRAGGERTARVAMNFLRPLRGGLRWERGHSSTGFLRGRDEIMGSEQSSLTLPPTPGPCVRAHILYCRFLTLASIVSLSQSWFWSTTWPHSSWASLSAWSSHCS